MFRAVLPRAAPRASLRACGPKAVPSNFIATPMLWVGGSKRGYAAESGMFLPKSNDKYIGGFSSASRMRLLISRLSGQQGTTISLSSVVVLPVTLLPLRLARRV